MSENLRVWAVEQAIKLHGQHGFATDALLKEAQSLLDWAQETKKQAKADARRELEKAMRSAD